MARTVTMIPASVTSRFSNLPVSVPKQRRVAAYARVSTEKEEQLSSYERRSITIPSTSRSAPTGISSLCIRMRGSRRRTPKNATASIR